MSQESTTAISLQPLRYEDVIQSAGAQDGPTVQPVGVQNQTDDEGDVLQLSEERADLASTSRTVVIIATLTGMTVVSSFSTGLLTEACRR